MVSESWDSVEREVGVVGVGGRGGVWALFLQGDLERDFLDLFFFFLVEVVMPMERANEVSGGVLGEGIAGGIGGG